MERNKAYDYVMLYNGCLRSFATLRQPINVDVPPC